MSPLGYQHNLVKKLNSGTSRANPASHYKSRMEGLKLGPLALATSAINHSPTLRSNHYFLKGRGRLFPNTKNLHTKAAEKFVVQGEPREEKSSKYFLPKRFFPSYFPRKNLHNLKFRKKICPRTLPSPSPPFSRNKRSVPNYNNPVCMCDVITSYVRTFMYLCYIYAR